MGKGKGKGGKGNNKSVLNKNINKRKMSPSSPNNSQHPPPPKASRTENTAASTVTNPTTSTPAASGTGIHSSTINTQGSSPAPSASSPSSASSVPSSLSASALSQIEPMPAPEEIAAMTAASPTDKTNYDINIQPLLDNMLQAELHDISHEGKQIVKSIAKILDFGLLSATTKYDDRLRLKDIQIAVLTHKNAELEDKISQLERRLNAHDRELRSPYQRVDEQDQYERRDTIIISGDELPEEHPDENSANVVVSTLNRVLELNTSVSDINIAHRLGRKSPTSHGEPPARRPIIVKLQSRMLKQNIVRRCIVKKPKLYVNESLTPPRRTIYRRFLAIRKERKGLIESLHTTDGRIVLKLKDLNERFVVTDEHSLNQLLSANPVLFGAYHSVS